MSRRPEVIEVVILNPTTADETIAELAAGAGEREIDLISGNEQRLLRFPAIIGAMYMNRHARMSTVDRAVEVAVRAGVRVPGIPAWDEVVAAVLGTRKDPAAAGKDPAQLDAMFSQVAALAAENPAVLMSAITGAPAAPEAAAADDVADDEGEPVDDEEEEPPRPRRCRSRCRR